MLFGDTLFKIVNETFSDRFSRNTYTCSTDCEDLLKFMNVGTLWPVLFVFQTRAYISSSGYLCFKSLRGLLAIIETADVDVTKLQMAAGDNAHA